MAGNEYADRANRYIEDVLSGRVPACRWVKAACERQKADLSRKDFEWHFDEQRAWRVCRFISLLRHVKGPLAGERIELQPWQCFILTTIFGWVDSKGHRRYHEAFVEVPRGSGKSTLMSGVALYMLCADGEKGADVYSFATTREQAKIVFDDAQAMARNNTPLKERYGLSVLAHSIVVPGTNSRFMAKSADAGTLDGLNTHCAIIDELHAHKTRTVYDVVKTSIGKRAQPLLFCITTAGTVLDGIWMEQRQYVQKILSHQADDDTLFGIVYTIDEGDDWKTEDAVRKASPNFGVSVQPREILSLLSKAIATPAEENNYKTKYLDIPCTSNHAWMPILRWQKCARDIRVEDFQGQFCIYGIDLASKSDITAIIKIFWRPEPDGVHYFLFPDFWLPSEQILHSPNSQYKGWHSQGLIHSTEGPVIDLDAIQEWLARDFMYYQTLAIGYDPWQATQLAQNLMQYGAPMVEVSPNVKNFSEPMKQFQALVLQGRIHYAPNPVMDWMMSNVVCHTDAKDNIYPRKEKPENKIDGVVASITCMNQCIQLQVETNYIQQPSDSAIMYESTPSVV